MQRIQITLLFIVTFLSFIGNSQANENQQQKDSIPEAIGWVNDFENLFTNSEEKILEQIILELEKETSVELVIVTIDSVFTSKENFYSFSLKLSNEWGVGKKETDNGIVIVISRQLRSIRINTGLGAEKWLSDEEPKSIIDNDFIPSFRKGEYFEGTKKGLQALVEIIHAKSK